MADEARRTRWWRLENSWWILLPALSFGWLGWSAFAYLGLRTRSPRLLAWAAGYFALAAVAFTLVVVGGKDSWEVAVGTVLTFVAWIGGVIHLLAIRDAVLEQIGFLEDPRLTSARHRRLKRAVARDLASRRPGLALEAGVGSGPDALGGVVDVNHAPAEAIATLPGFRLDLAQKVVEIREHIGGFDSVLDFATVLDLPPAVFDEIRDRTVCLPR